jgi:hypothetical protein
MSTIKADTLSNLAGTQTVPVDTVAQGTARAWVNFNGTGTVAIRASFNVSSITDNGTGDYTVNFTTALPDADYSIVFGVQSTNDVANTALGQISSQANPTSSTCRIRTSIPQVGYSDNPIVCVSVFR